MPTAPTIPEVEIDDDDRLDQEPPADDLPPEDGDGDGDGDNRGDSYDGPWVTVATFWQPPQVHVARLRLESEDIPCLILDENLIATDWLYANAIGGIKLQVPAADAARARELLATSPAAAGAIVADAAGSALPYAQPRCPCCGSAHVIPQRLSRRLMFLCILVLGAPLPIFRATSRCDDCGFEWRPRVRT